MEIEENANLQNQQKITNTIANELNVKPTQVGSAINLIDEGNTIPFIARYR